MALTGVLEDVRKRPWHEGGQRWKFGQSQIASLGSKIALDSRMTDLPTILQQLPVGCPDALSQLLRAAFLRPQHLIRRTIVTTEFHHLSSHRKSWGRSLATPDSRRNVQRNKKTK